MAGLVLRASPLQNAPAGSAEYLFGLSTPTPIGYLTLGRGRHVGNRYLEQGDYEVGIQMGRAVFRTLGGDWIDPEQPAQLRRLRDAEPVPKALITLAHTSFSWDTGQISVPLAALSDDEKAPLQQRMEAAIKTLEEKGLLGPDQIDLTGTISAVEGDSTVIQEGRATMLVAPNSHLPLHPEDLQEDLRMVPLGALEVLEEVTFSAKPRKLPPASYTIHAVMEEDGWVLHFRHSSANGTAQPAKCEPPACIRHPTRVHHALGDPVGFDTPKEPAISLGCVRCFCFEWGDCR